MPTPTPGGGVSLSLDLSNHTGDFFPSKGTREILTQDLSQQGGRDALPRHGPSILFVLPPTPSSSITLSSLLPALKCSLPPFLFIPFCFLDCASCAQGLLPTWGLNSGPRVLLCTPALPRLLPVFSLVPSHLHSSPVLIPAFVFLLGIRLSTWFSPPRAHLV